MYMLIKLASLTSHVYTKTLQCLKVALTDTSISAVRAAFRFWARNSGIGHGGNPLPESDDSYSGHNRLDISRKARLCTYCYPIITHISGPEAGN